MECLFCQIQQGQVPVPGGFIYEDELVCATHYSYDTMPVYLGNLVVQTKRHAPTFADLTYCEARAVGLLVTRLSRALKACVGAERSYVVFFGEVVPHLHVFVTARYPDTPPEYWRSNISAWPDAPRGGPEEVSALCDKLRAYLAQTV
ncbi:MAG TPA: HIT family protein [Ktedonobacteraceae bacterium]|nr:HIT family protein [Ktedonobacteraceae bacterium]